VLCLFWSITQSPTPGGAPTKKGHNIMFNALTLTGRLVKDPTSYPFGSGDTVTNITIAVERNVKVDANGDRPVDFIQVAFFGTRAELVAKKTRKGDLVGVEGSIRQKKRTVGDENRYELQVIGNRIHFLAKMRTDSNIMAASDEEYDDTNDQDRSLEDLNVDDLNAEELEGAI
jgi:single-strand DNA-binding protein